MIYKNTEHFERDFPFFHSILNPADVLLFLIAEKEEKRKSLVDLTKKILEKMIEEAKEKKEINFSGIQIFNMKDYNSTYFESLIHKTIPSSGRNERNDVYIPIYHNADKFHNLAQTCFDSRKPGIISVSQAGYLAVFNSSKRDCFDVLRS